MLGDCGHSRFQHPPDRKPGKDSEATDLREMTLLAPLLGSRLGKALSEVSSATPSEEVKRLTNFCRYFTISIYGATLYIRKMLSNAEDLNKIANFYDS